MFVERKQLCERDQDAKLGLAERGGKVRDQFEGLGERGVANFR
jgi:hypothetical protein